MSTPKQVIVVRKDLNMRKGKIAAQVAHASMAVILQHMQRDVKVGIELINPPPIWVTRTLHLRKDDALNEWLDGKFTKICVSVDSEQELKDIYSNAKSKGLICSMIEDSGATEFNGIPTLTCCAIGPDYPEKIDEITKHLKLL